MASILISGVCGFIGSNVAEYFFEKGWEVFGIDNFIRKGVEENAAILERIGCKVIRGDIRCQEDFRSIPKVDAVINLAANPGIPWSIQNPIYDARVNLMGALNVYEFAKECNACVIQASTNKVYSDEINSILFKKKGTRYTFPPMYKYGINEKFPVDGLGRPHSPYGCSKLAADIYAQEYNTTFNVPTVICRMSAIYGPRQMGVSEQGWIVWFMYCKKHGIPLEIFGDGLQVRDILYISDLCDLYYLLIEEMDRCRGSIFNIGGGRDNTISVLEMVNWLNKKGGNPLQIKFSDWRIADHKVYISDIRKVKEVTGWQPKIGVQEGLEKTWKWVI